VLQFFSKTKQNMLGFCSMVCEHIVTHTLNKGVTAAAL